MTTVADINKLEVQPVPAEEVSSPSFAGFYIRAFKRHNRRTTGFLVSGIRSVHIEQPRPKRVRTRISWQPDGESFEVEEHVSMAMRRSASITTFSVNFKTLEFSILRGNPQITKNSFRGKSIELSWTVSSSPTDQIFVLRPSQGKSLTCRLRRKQKTIEIEVEE